VALIVGIDRFMSEARALTSTMSNAVACVVVSIWEKACDREVLARELAQDYANTELALEQEASIPTASAAAGLQSAHLH
jgi:Na+/H+-dicarboxylate symporter